MSKEFNIAVVGATGNVGREMLDILAERQFPVKNIVALASSKSVGKEVSFGDDKVLKVQDCAKFDFKNTHFVFSSPGASVSAEHSPRACEAGAIVIDNTSHFRMHKDVPLIVPEVNFDALQQHHKAAGGKGYIIANPNCSTIQMVMALKPLHELATIKRVVVSTYQSVSGSGKDAMNELFSQTRAVFVNDPIECEVYPKQIAFNCIPHIDSFMDDGYTKEEWKMRVETKKILDPDIQVTANCVRVPVFVSHAEMINIETVKPITVESAKHAFSSMPNLLIYDKHEGTGYVTQRDAVGEDATYVSRIRQDKTVEHGLSFWCVSDNLRKGAALNAVQIAEYLIENNQF